MIINYIKYGWERWPEEDYVTNGVYVTAYCCEHRGNMYMLTHSTDYVKIIVKGSTKELNEQLFKGMLRDQNELETVLKIIGL
jgi:hypothetical protein